jgi:hypothetical protein
MATSIRRFHPDTKVIAYIGQAQGRTLDATGRALRAFAGHDIGLCWIGADDFNAWTDTRSPYLATMNARWHAETKADHIIIADADIIFTHHLEYLFMHDAVLGVMAHVRPMSEQDMRYLYNIAGADWNATGNHPYSGNGVMGPIDASGPFYVNSGFVFIPRTYFEAMVPHYHYAIGIMRSAMRDTYWFDQLALALAVARSGVPCTALPLRFNFPNQAAFDTAHPRELDSIRVLHYLREDVINRTTDFESLPAIRRLVARTDLKGSNEVLRRTVAEVMGCLEPARLERAEDAPYA